MDPCQGSSYELQWAIAILAAFNTALASFLTNRRVRADRERRNGHSAGCPQCGFHQKRKVKVGGPTDGPAE